MPKEPNLALDGHENGNEAEGVGTRKIHPSLEQATYEWFTLFCDWSGTSHSEAVEEMVRYYGHHALSARDRDDFEKWAARRNQRKPGAPPLSIK